MTTILVPLDGSPLAEHALPVAKALARASSARLVLTYARWIANATDPRAPDLEGIAAALRADGLTVETHARHLPSTEEAGATLLAAADEFGAGLIVMATHGHGGLGRVLYGSVADQVLRQTTVPLILVTPHNEGAWPTDRPLRVLVPLDGSERAEEIFSPLQATFGPLAAEFVLLRVANSIDYARPHGDQCDICRAARLAGYEPDIEPVRIRDYLTGVAIRLRAAGLQVDVQGEMGDAASTIVRVAQERQVDLIAMATHGRGGFHRLILGSVATDTLRRAPVPLFLVRSVPSAEARTG
jgi:nucleotide-binding universal stress UspA family protein